MLKSHRLQALYWLTNHDITCCNWFTAEQKATVITEGNLEEIVTSGLYMQEHIYLKKSIEKQL